MKIHFFISLAICGTIYVLVYKKQIMRYIIAVAILAVALVIYVLFAGKLFLLFLIFNSNIVCSVRGIGQDRNNYWRPCWKQFISWIVSIRIASWITNIWWCIHGDSFCSTGNCLLFVLLFYCITIINMIINNK